MNGTWVRLPNKPQPFMIYLSYIEEDGSETVLFYRETEDTKDWIIKNENRNVSYFTEDERDIFRGFSINLTILNGSQTLDQRRELFVALSKGKPVTGNDVKKNFHKIPLIAEIDRMGWEFPMRELIRDHCHVKADRFWLNWLVRMFLLSKTPSAETCALSDSVIGGYMKHDAPSDKLDFDPTEIDTFIRTMNKLLGFNLGIKHSPIRIHALFVKLLTATDDEIIQLQSHETTWPEETKEERKLWTRGTTTDIDRMAYFEKVTGTL